MDSQTATSHFDAIANKVVSLCSNFLGMFVQQWDIFWIGHGKRMMCCHQSLFLVAPLKEWEIDNPQTLKLVLISQAEPFAHLKSQRTQLYTGLVRLVSAQNQHKIAIFSPHLLFHR